MTAIRASQIFFDLLGPNFLRLFVSKMTKKYFFFKFYRLMVVQLEKREALAKEAKMLERKKAAAIKRQVSSSSSKRRGNRLNEAKTTAAERPTTRRKTNRSSSGTDHDQLIFLNLKHYRVSQQVWNQLSNVCKQSELRLQKSLYFAPKNCFFSLFCKLQKMIMDFLATFLQFISIY